MTRNFTLYLTLFVLILSACKKKSEAPKQSLDIYALGSISNSNIVSPVYWKNGQLTNLQASNSTNTFINAIALHGTDIYTAGSNTNSNGLSQAAYWKNGIIKDLSTGFTASTIKSIAFNGNDTYMLGFGFTSEGQYPIIWKNDVPMQLPGVFSVQNYLDLMFDHNDLYLLVDASTTTNTQVAGYEKNGILVKVRDTTSSSDATAMAINGNDVYLCGNAVINSTVSAVYWKNGIMVQLATQGQGAANAITVSGNDVYVAGTNNGATIWKNGQIIFHDTGTLSVASSIVVDGTDIYAGGYDNARRATIWKNGQAMQLTISMPSDASRVSKLVLLTH